MSNARTIASLDGIRALSVTTVILAHSGFEKKVPGGFGVTVFFFLSGFLITHLLLKELRRDGRISFSGFYTRRCARILPPFFIALLLCYIWSVFTNSETTARAIIAQLLMATNYYVLVFDQAKVEIIPNTLILWSLSVEEHFYLVYPLLLFICWWSCGKQEDLFKKRFFWLLVLLCLSVLANRILVAYFYEENAAAWNYYSTDARFDSILYGAIFALLFFRSKKAQPLGSCDNPTVLESCLFVFSIGVILSTFLIRDPWFRETLRYSIQGVALMPLFYFSIKYCRIRPFVYLNGALIKKIGVYSYFMYLIHVLVIDILVYMGMGFLNRGDMTLFLLSTFVSVLLAALVHMLVEQPIAKFRQRLNED